MDSDKRSYAIDSSLIERSDLSNDHHTMLTIKRFIACITMGGSDGMYTTYASTKRQTLLALNQRGNVARNPK